MLTVEGYFSEGRPATFIQQNSSVSTVVTMLDDLSFTIHFAKNQNKLGWQKSGFLWLDFCQRLAADRTITVLEKLEFLNPV